MIIFKHIGECANEWVCSVTLNKGQSLTADTAVCNASMSLNHLSVSNAIGFNLCSSLLNYILQLLLYKKTTDFS